jgi:hypothetical protein
MMMATWRGNCRDFTRASSSWTRVRSATRGL